MIQRRYSGSPEERFEPTLAAEHLAEEDGIAVDHETLRRWMLAEGLLSRQRKCKKHCQRGSAKRILESWCSWKAAFMIGWKGEERAAI